MNTIEGVECYVAPWALVGEEFPIHVIIGPNIIFDSIRVLIPQSLMIVDFMNVVEYISNNQEVILTKLYTNDFFGLILIQKEKLDSIHLEKEFIIEFLKNDAVILRQALRANFYRPFLEVTEAPKQVRISDKTRLKSLMNFRIRVMGFGRVNVQTEIDTGTNIQIQFESYFMNLLRLLIAKYSGSEEIRPDDERFADPEWIFGKMKHVIEEINDEEMPPRLKEKAVEEAHKWITKTPNIGKIFEELSKALEAYFLDLLLFQFEKYPAENVSLSHGIPFLFAKQFDGNLLFRFRYWDSMGNEYAPIEIPIIIDDQRTNREPRKIPINIEWERTPYHISKVMTDEQC
jgi:hypothetical protein